MVLAVGDDITESDLPDEFRTTPQQRDSFLLELPEERDQSRSG